MGLLALLLLLAAGARASVPLCFADEVRCVPDGASVNAWADCQNTSVIPTTLYLGNDSAPVSLQNVPVGAHLSAVAASPVALPANITGWSFVWTGDGAPALDLGSGTLTFAATGLYYACLSLPGAERQYLQLSTAETQKRCWAEPAGTSSCCQFEAAAGSAWAVVGEGAGSACAAADCRLSVRRLVVQS